MLPNSNNLTLYANDENIDYQYDILIRLIETNTKNKIDLKNENNIIENIITSFFSIYINFRYTQTPDALNYLSKFFLKIRKFEILTKLISYTNFIDNLKKNIAFDSLKPLDFEIESHLKIRTQFIPTDIIFQLILNTNEYQEYINNHIKNLIHYYSNDTYCYYRLLNDNIIQIKDLKQKMNYKPKDDILNIRINRINLLYLEDNLRSHFISVKRNTSKYIMAYNRFKQSLSSFNNIITFIPFGSLTQYSYSSLSDLEITYITNDNDKDKINSKDLLNRLSSKIKSYMYYNKVEIRITTRTDLLILYDTIENIKIETMINNKFGVLNSELIRNYCLYDARCLILINIIKDWSKIKEINGNFNGYISSYCYSLMVIFFLQKIKKNILPVFPVNKDKIEYYSAEGLHYYNDINYNYEQIDSNDTPISELLIKFFVFYYSLFDGYEYCIDIRSELPVYRFNQVKYLNYNGNNKSSYCFIDPIDYSYNPGKYLIKGSVKEERFREEMRMAIQRIINNESIFN